MSKARVPAAARGGATTEQELLLRVSRGDTDALVPLYQRFSARAFGICLRILRDRSEAEEVLQETFLEVWRRAREYDPKRGGIEAWIATISRTRAIDHVRSRRTASRAADAAPAASLMSEPPSAPDLSAAAGQDKAAVSAALKQLPTGQRKAIELAYFEGLSHSEISDRTGDPLGTVKTRVRLGMEKLAGLLRRKR